MSQHERAPASLRQDHLAIALDGGTTNTRARLVHNGRIVATARREIGVRDAVLRDPTVSGMEPSRPTGTALAPGLAAAVREVIEEVTRAAEKLAPADSPPEVDLIVAAGMLTADVGLLAVPHVEAPAGIADLAAAVVVATLPKIGPRPIQFIPGVRTPRGPGPDGWMRADVMRGEECETLGALAQLVARGQVESEPGGGGMAFLWPGSHTKLVEVDGRGRITQSQTSLAGELIQAIARHTLIAASLPDALPERLDLAAVEAGARAVHNQGLERAAFLVRLAAVNSSLTPDQRAAFWIGAVVADDVGHLREHPIAARGKPVWVGGREPLRGLYARWFGQGHEGPVTALDEELAEGASAFGALGIVAFHREWVGRA